MRKFLLADPSLADASGHYFEYAGRVLKAAQAAGLAPFLAVNAAFDLDTSKLPWPVLRTFKYDIWGNDPSSIRPIAMPTAADQRALKVMLSLGSFYWSLAANAAGVRHYMQRIGMPAHRLRRFELGRDLFRRVHQLEKNTPFTRDAMAFDVRFGATIQRIRDVLAKRLPLDCREAAPDQVDVSVVHRTTEAAENFAWQLDDLARSLELKADDIIFLPTVSWSDTAGLAEFLSDREPERVPFIAPVFRRNIFPGPPDMYLEQAFAVHDYRWILSRVNTHGSGVKLVICTDTEELSQQYRHITESVVTLPVPTPTMPSTLTTRGGGDTITLGYLGDARQEKGFQYLPLLLNMLCSDDLKYRIRIKAQVHTPKGPQDIAVLRAIEQLRLRAPRDSDLLETPLGSDDYKSLIAECDAVLVLYERENYRARSSGIFVEALCARRPVITTAGTSMSALLDASTYTYHKTRIGHSAIVSRFTPESLRWHQFTDRGDIPCLDIVETGLLLSESSRPHTEVARPSNASHVWITFSHNAPVQGLFTTIFIAQRRGRREITSREYILGGLGAETLSLLVPLYPACDDIWVRFYPYGESRGYMLRDLVIRFVRVSDPIARVVGGVTAKWGDLNDIAQATMELIEDFDPIVETADLIGEELARTQTPERLVQILLSEIEKRHAQLAGSQIDMPA